MNRVDCSEYLNEKIRGELTLEEILQSSDLINDLKNNSDSDFADLYVNIL